jgi:sirohydrochlorin ferrochelatase
MTRKTEGGGQDIARIGAAGAVSDGAVRPELGSADADGGGMSLDCLPSGGKPGRSGKPGVLVNSHGSRETGWVRLVEEAVAAAAASDRLQGVPVVCSFLELVEGRLIQDGIDRLAALGVTELFVLPLFVSSGSTHVDDIGQAFGMPPVGERAGELERFRIGSMRVTCGDPIDDDPDIAELLYANIRELSADPEREAVLLIAHGSGEPAFHERWQRGMRLLADRVRTLGGFARAETAMLLPDQAASRMEELQRDPVVESVLVVPLFLSAGYFTQKVIPSRLNGYSYKYNGKPLLPHPYIVRWMERRAAAWLETLEVSAVDEQTGQTDL